MCKVIRLNEVDSTNSYLVRLSNTSDLDSFVTVLARKQTAGRGQYNNSWVSDEGKNLTFSFVINDFLLENNFVLNKYIAISLVHSLEDIGLDNITVKWPNDIMYKGKKIGGILMESTLVGETIKRLIVGIGINVNQVNFDNIPYATSMQLAAQKGFDLDIIFDKIHTDLISELKTMNWEKNMDRIDREYQQKLFKRKEVVQMKINDNLAEVVLLGVNRTGGLVVERNDVIEELHHPHASILYQS